MTDDEARKLVRAVLTEMGIDVADPTEMQADFVFLRRHRLAKEKIGVAGAVAIWGLVLSGIASLIWLGVQAAFGIGDPPS
jgi:hypothetical protein